MNLGIGDQNVVVLSTPRTGSTALCHKIADELNLHNYNEAFHPDYPFLADHLWQSLADQHRFICKIFPNHNITQEQLDRLCEDSFVIFLERQDLVEQIASYHALSITNRAWFAKSDEHQPYMIDVDNTKVSFSIRQILALRQDAEVYRQRADITLKYEDILDMIENDHIRRYDRPDNYEELVSKIKKLIPIFGSER